MIALSNMRYKQSRQIINYSLLTLRYTLFTIDYRFSSG